VGTLFCSITNSTSGDTRDHPERHGGTKTGVGEVEVGVSMAESGPFRSDTDSLNALKPTSPKRPKKPRVERRGSRNRNNSSSAVKASLTQVQVKLLSLLFLPNLLEGTYKIATLNIIGMSAMMRMQILTDFLHKQEIDIILLQEVNHTGFDLIRGYIA
jgi:hypothetical protein